jgi:hypothetical protein
LDCGSNQLQSLDVLVNAQLTSLSCYSNPLSLIKLPTSWTLSFAFSTTPTSNPWTAYQYATSGKIYCNPSVTITNFPVTWDRFGT